MKALTLTQPWATLVAIGAKRFETRSWATPYRGPIAIHAAKGFPREAQLLCLEQPFLHVLANHGYYEAGCYLGTFLPRGMVVATAELADCIPTDDLVRADTWLHLLTDQEDAFGDFDPGRYAWLLENVIRLDEPVPARGALGLWEWTPAAMPA